MNLIDFTKNGGFRFKQFTLRKMQEAYMHILKVFIEFCNVPQTGNYIISGMKILDTNITSGYCYIDGELCRFEQSTGTITTKIKKNVVTQTLGFKNGNNEEVFRFVNAITHETEGVAFSTFVRVSPVFDPNYVHTDSNFTADEKTKLAGIETGAEKNVQSDWNQTNPASDDFIKNKPTGQLMTYLLKNSFVHGDLITSRQIVTIPFGNVGTSNYTVLGTLVGQGTWQNEAPINWVIREKTATSFKLCMYDVSNEGGQNITFDYVIIPNN